ncbi:F-box domain-containing protein [Phlyctema vagabunda]|uniref:F-box domain-containing protein n=1 Tax=Phlyctema vagabunda TaxID=108571 RepID=A0ABR4PI90_9HELO
MAAQAPQTADLAALNNDNGAATTRIPESSAANVDIHDEVEKETRRVNIGLPNELLCQIFNLMDRLPRSNSRCWIIDEPELAISHCEPAAHLKAISLVSKQWHAVVLPILFKYTRIISHQPWHTSHEARKQTQPFFDFINQTSLNGSVISFTLAVPHRSFEVDSSFITRHVEVFWEDLFNTIDPAKVLLVASPVALGLLTGCHVGPYNAKIYEAPYHYLHLQRAENAKSEVAKAASEQNATQSTDPIPSKDVVASDEDGSINPATSDLADSQPVSTLLSIRPWKRLLLNEGSFIKGYSSGGIDDFIAPAPTILTDLFGCSQVPDEDNDGDTDGVEPRRALINPSISEVSYVGMFPPNRHFQKFVHFLPAIESVHVQLVPRNTVLHDVERMAGVVEYDLWHQRNSAYATIVRELFNPQPRKNYATLRKFESGDTADIDAWHMAVEFVRRSGAAVGWGVECDGVFVRDSKYVKPPQ